MPRHVGVTQATIDRFSGGGAPGEGTVTTVSVASANGLAGSVANATSTPAITLTTTVTGLMKGNGTAISAAAADTDYLAPATAAATYQPLDADLTAIAGLDATGGLLAKTAANTYARRTITGTANKVTVTNGDGVSGNPTLTLPDALTLVTPALGTPASGNLSSCTADGTDAVGFRNIPQNSKSAAYTTVLADAGKHIYHPGADTSARTWTIDSNANVAYPIGTAITFINDTSGGVITIAITSDTMILAGAGTTGSRTLAANGVATAIKMTSTRWIISGTGLT